MFYTWLFFASVASSTLTFDEAKAFADRDEEGATNAQAEDFKMSFEKIGRYAFSKCMPLPLPEVVPNFTVVMKVDAEGKVQNIWPSDASEFTKCIENKFAVATLPKPPKNPFYTSFEFIFGSAP